jgi:glycine/D-amino acid oxidase-like deaminating enzyme
MLATGLTLRHYRSFVDCPTLPAVRDRIARQSPLFDRYGIHVLVSQNARGELTLGDSHEYESSANPFDKAEIDDLILAHMGTFLEAPDLKIATRWHGVYAKHPDRAAVILQPAPGVTVVTGLGGAGITLSLGLAERVVRRALGEADTGDRFLAEG